MFIITIALAGVAYNYISNVVESQKIPKNSTDVVCGLQTFPVMNITQVQTFENGTTTGIISLRVDPFFIPLNQTSLKDAGIVNITFGFQLSNLTQNVCHFVR